MWELGSRGDDRFAGTTLLDNWGFLSKSKTRGLSAIELGFFQPWWTAPDYTFKFFRPLSMLDLRLDFFVFQDRLWLAHLHSLLWYAFLLAGLAALYKTIYPPRRTSSLHSSKTEAGLRFTTPDKIAFLAWIFFALNDVMGAPLVWNAHRYALIAVSLGIWTLWAHERYMQDLGSAWPGPLFFTLALLAGETATAFCGYLFLRSVKRPLRLIPYFLITAAYLTFYILNGYGVKASGMYINPFGQPLEFAIAIFRRWPVMADSLFSPVSANIWLYAETALWIRHVLTILGYAVVGLMLWTLKPFRDKTESWLMGGALLSLIPFCAMFPADRLLLVACIGVFPVIARYTLEKGKGLLFWFFLVTHLFLAAPLIPGQAALFSSVQDDANKKIKSIARKLPSHSETLVLLNAPGITLGYEFMAIMGFYYPEKIPEYFRLLTTNTKSVKITRLDDYSLDMEAQFLSTEVESGFRSPTLRFSVGEKVELSRVGFSATILEINEAGKPEKVRFRFNKKLEDITIFSWWIDDFKFITPPPVGKSLTVPPAAPYPYI